MTKTDSSKTQTRESRQPQKASSLAASRRRSGWKKTQYRALGAAGIALLLVVWEVAPRLLDISPSYLPPVSDVIANLFGQLFEQTFWLAVGHTLMAWFLGMLIATFLGTAAGFLVGSSMFLRRATHSSIEFLRPVPSVALIPLAVLLFGMKIESTLLLVVYAAFWQILVQVLYGVADVDRVAMNTARSYGLSSLARLRHVVFPTTLPYLMTGIRLASAIALILAITAELVIGSPGLGKEIALARSSGAVTDMYALVLTTGLLGLLLNNVMRQIERRTLHWHPSNRSEIE